VIILANHMNGKDTHVRGLRVLGPIEFNHVTLFSVVTSHSLLIINRDQTYDGDPFTFESKRYKLFEVIR